MKIQSLSSQELMKICDRYFLTAEELAPQTETKRPPRNRDQVKYVEAHNELWNRGAEVRDWARGLLTHVDYDAREAGAGLLGSLGGRRLLGESEDKVITELGQLIQRPMEEDSKEMQAVDVAILALSEIGNAEGIKYLRWILFSTRPEHTGDTQWTAAEALAKMVKQPFLRSKDPVEAARDWLRTHPDT